MDKKNNFAIIGIVSLLFVTIVACSIGTSVGQSPSDVGTQAPFGVATTTEIPLPVTGNDSSTAVAPTIAAGPTAAPPTAPPPIAGTGNFANSIVAVAQRVKPAVVQITNQQVQVDQFNQPYNVPAGVGSGVIYDAQGDILTNNHVVEGAQSLLVSLPDGRSFKGKLVGTDPQTDLAVVQISGDNLPAAELGNSDSLQVGDWVVAIGNALALPGGPTVSAGVVSALGRSVQEPASQTSNTPGPMLFDMIQTDAPINPGNSGGPLVNLAGQVIGINTLVAGQAEPGVQAQGIGFSISITSVKPIIEQIITTGHVVHPYLGIEYQPLNPAIAAQLGLRQTYGAFIGNVVSGSPAEKAGIQPNDVITAIDNQPLKLESDLAQFLNKHKPGDKVTLTVARGNQTSNVQVTLGQAPNP